MNDEWELQKTTMTDGDPKKPSSPEEIFRSGIKAAVSAANSTLTTLEQSTEGARKSTANVFETVAAQSSVVTDTAKNTYNRRHEFAPELIGGSALLGGGFMALRRGRIAGVLGAAVAAGAAYAVVYDEINLERVPDLIFGKK